MNQETTPEVTLTAEETARLDAVAAQEANYSHLLKSVINSFFHPTDALSASTIEAVKENIHTHYLHKWVDALSNGKTGTFPQAELLNEMSSMNMMSSLHPLIAADASVKTMLNMQFEAALDALEEVPEGSEAGSRHTAAVALGQLAHLINTLLNCLGKEFVMSPRTKKRLISLVNQHIVILRDLIQDGDVDDEEIRDMGSAYLIVVQQKLYSLEYAKDPHSSAICERNWNSINNKVRRFCASYFKLPKKMAEM